jgi:hypothetical protein
LARAREIVERLLCTLALAAAPGCDIVQGFQNAGDALFPPVKTYLDVPGFALAPGSYRDLGLLTTSEPFVFARSSDPSDGALYVMRYQAPHACRIADVTGWWTDGTEDAPRTFVAYFDASGSSTLHFSDTACRKYELTLDDADFPVAVTKKQLIVRAGSDLLAVDPEAGSTTVLASGVRSVDATRRLVLANGELGSFDRDWTLLGWFGSGVKRFVNAFGAVYFEDADGIGRLRVTSGTTPSASASNVVEDACDLAVIPTTPYLDLLAFHAPCADRTLAVWDTDTQKKTELMLPAAPAFLKLAVEPKAEFGAGTHPNLAVDPYWALYLTDVDTESRTGSLVVRTPAGDDLAIGDGAALERAELTARTAGAAYTGGFALLDTAAGSGRYVRFDAAGAVNDIATGVVREPANPVWNRLVLEVDDQRADLAEVVDGELVTVAHDVPRQRYAFAPSHPVPEFTGKMAWLEGYDGHSATLSVAGPDTSTGVVDDQRHEPLYTSSVVARGVYPFRNGFMNDLPGLVYLTHYDLGTQTGTLEYSNAELGFSAIVSEGAADYVQPGSGLLYSVPFGAGAGLWLARAK